MEPPGALAGVGTGYSLAGVGGSGGHVQHYKSGILPTGLVLSTDLLMGSRFSVHFHVVKLHSCASGGDVFVGLPMPFMYDVTMFDALANLEMDLHTSRPCNRRMYP